MKSFSTHSTIAFVLRLINNFQLCLDLLFQVYDPHYRESDSVLIVRDYPPGDHFETSPKLDDRWLLFSILGN